MCDTGDCVGCRYMNHAGGGMYGTGGSAKKESLGEAVGRRYVSHAGADRQYECDNVNCTKTHDDRGRHFPNKIMEEAAETKPGGCYPNVASGGKGLEPGPYDEYDDTKPSSNEFMSSLVAGMDDSALREYLKRQRTRVPSLERELAIAKAVLGELEREADKRGL